MVNDYKAREQYLRKVWLDNERRARARTHRFTRRTYRRARRRAISTLIARLDWLHQLERSRNDAWYFGNVDAYEEVIPTVRGYAADAQREGLLIVARARREKGMWR
ncbi:MAG: hypothetical protein ACTH4Y_08180 [Microbacterium gubbeenense]|uniref:hypothetical protein n=1 Tax=Microbacterium gubbeenense TaxID=159896 RepID=UPI003F976EE2